MDQHVERRDLVGVDATGLLPEIELAVGDGASRLRALGLAEAVRALLNVGRAELATLLVNELVELLAVERAPKANVIPIDASRRSRR